MRRNWWSLSCSSLHQAQSPSVVLGLLGVPSSSEVSLGHGDRDRLRCHVDLTMWHFCQGWRKLSLCAWGLLPVTHRDSSVSCLCESLGLWLQQKQMQWPGHKGWAGEMAQGVMCLPCQCENLSLIFRTQWKTNNKQTSESW